MIWLCSKRIIAVGVNRMKMNDTPRERIRRDYTNASGYISPTENEAIFRADRGISDSYIAPMRKPDIQVMRPTAEQPAQDADLKRMRQLFAALTAIAGLADATIVDIKFKCKGNPARYGLNEQGATIRRMD